MSSSSTNSEEETVECTSEEEEDFESAREDEDFYTANEEGHEDEESTPGGEEEVRESTSEEEGAVGESTSQEEEDDDDYTDCSESESEEEPADYHHIIVFQAIKFKEYLDQEGMFRLIRKVCKILKCKDPKEHQKLPFIQKICFKINTEILKDYETYLRLATCELTQKEYYVYCAKTWDRSIMFAEKLMNRDEFLYLRHLLDIMLDKNNPTLFYSECLQMAEDMYLVGFKTPEADALLKKLLKMEYLIRIPPEYEKGFKITASFRTLKQLEPYFMHMYPDQIAKCVLCNSIMWMVIRQCIGCGTFMHQHCLESYLKLEYNCPRCQRPWNKFDRIHLLDDRHPTARGGKRVVLKR